MIKTAKEIRSQMENDKNKKIKTAKEIQDQMEDDKNERVKEIKKEESRMRKYLKNLAISDASKLLKKEIPELAIMFCDYNYKFQKHLPNQYDVNIYYDEFKKLCNKYGYKATLENCNYWIVYNTLYITISWEK